MKAVKGGAVGTFVPAVGILDRGECIGAGRLKLQAGSLFHLGSEPVDAAILDGVLQARMLAVGAVAEVALCCQHGLADGIHFVRGYESQDICETGESLRVAMTHSQSPADGHIVAEEFPVLGNRDEAEILGEDVDIVGGRNGEAGLEFAREIRFTIHRFALGFPSGDEFLVEVDLVVGPGLGQGEFAPGHRVGVNLLLDRIPLRVGRSHDVAVHVAAGGDGIEQDLMHALHELLDVSLEDSVKLKGLARGESQGRGGYLVGQLVEDEPLLGRGFAAGEADTEHECEGLFFPLLFEGIAQIPVILHVETVELGELVALFGDVSS